MHSLFTIGSSFDSSQLVSDFIKRYESEWTSLSTLSASGGESSYRNKLNDFLACDEAKRDILLSILIPHMSNVIDNITTKQTMTFNEAKHRLSSLPSSEFQQAAFLSAKSRRAIQRKSSKTNAAEKKKVCNWCKKHGYPCEGHLWFQCRRLKEEQAKRKKKEKDQKDQKGKGKADKDIKADIKPESAHVSMEVGQSSSQFESLSGQQQLSSQFEPLSGQQKLSVGSNQPSAGTDQPSAGTDVALTAVSKHHHKHENDWIFDTAASSHMTSDLGRFETFSANSGTIEVAGETFLEYKGKGSCLVYPLYPDGTTSVVRLINVLYVPTLGHNLISWNVLRNRFLCLMGGNHVHAKDTRDASQPLVLHGLFRGNLPFLVESKPNAFLTGSKPAFHTESSEPKPSTDLTAYSHWHKAFGHVDTFARNKSFHEDGEILPNFIKYNCQLCLLSKSVHHPPEPNLTRATKPLERIFSDLSGKAPISSLGRSFYYISFIDDFTRFAWLYFLKEKSQAVAAIKDFINMVENQTSYVIQLFCSDGGGEYANNQLTAYFSQKGIVHEFTPPYAHEYNGVPEWFNRTLQNMARPWLVDLNNHLGLNVSHKRFWAEAYAAAVYTKNRLPHSSLQDMTPFEAFHHKKPSISHLQLFGRKCFIHIPKERRLPGSKVMPQAEEGIFLGYTDTPNIYKVHILARSHTFIVSALDVKFESVTADSRPEVEVTSTEVTPTTPVVTTTTSISFTRPITRSMTDSQQL